VALRNDHRGLRAADEQDGKEHENQVLHHVSVSFSA
jgi:hypothetical protein